MGDYYRIKCQQEDLLRKTANELLANTELIVQEELKIKALICRPKANQVEETGQYHPNGNGVKAGMKKSMADVSCGKFLSILKYKAQGLGKKMIAFNPGYTSQECSRCGKITKKSLSIRMHECPHCGLSINRFHNSAINILRLGIESQNLTTTSLHYRCGLVAGVVTQR